MRRSAGSLGCGSLHVGASTSKFLSILVRVVPRDAILAQSVQRQCLQQ